MLRIIARGYNSGDGTYNPSAEINFAIDGEPSTSGDASDMPGRIEFLTASNGTDSESIRMIIKNDGNVLVGTTQNNPTSSGVNVAGQEFSTTGGVRSTVASNPAATFNRKTDNGDIALFRKDGTTVGIIGSSSPALYIGSGDVGVRFDGANDRIRPVGNASNLEAVRDNAIDLGDSGARFKDLYLSGGAYLGGTGSANHLDDYEEGTWIPTDASGQGITGFTLSHNQYTKIGRKVFAHCQITFPSNSNTTLARLSLPFAPNANSNNSATGGVCQEQNIGSSITVVAAVNYTNGVIFRPNGYGNYSYADLSGKTLRFAIHYNAS